MSITAEVSSDSKELTIKVQGRFDFSLLQAFKDSYENVDPKPEKFIIDLEGSDYLDSSALGMLLALKDHAGGEDGSVKIINCNADVRKILTITKLDSMFDID